jgi:hypothetical protein
MLTILTQTNANYLAVLAAVHPTEFSFDARKLLRANWPSWVDHYRTNLTSEKVWRELLKG